MTRWPQMVSELFTVELSVWGKGVSVMTRSLQQPLASHGRDQWSRCRPPPGPGFASSRPPQELKHVPQCVYRFLSRTSGRWRCRISELITAFSSLRCFTLHWSVTQTFLKSFWIWEWPVGQSLQPCLLISSLSYSWTEISKNMNICSCGLKLEQTFLDKIFFWPDQSKTNIKLKD